MGRLTSRMTGISLILTRVMPAPEIAIMFRRIGELLVHYGELSVEELNMILAEQRREYRPFGRIAAEMFQIHETAIWRAWAEQYSEYAPRVNLNEQFRDSAVLDELSSDEAWKYHLLPLRAHDGDLIMVTSKKHLPVALHFLDHHHDKAVIVWLTEDEDQLEAALAESYPKALPAERSA